MRTATDVRVHVFHIDAYDIISDGGAGDVKPEGFLRARVDRALSCGKESCVLLLSLTLKPLQRHEWEKN